MNWCTLSCDDWIALECNDWILLNCCGLLCINAQGECAGGNLSGVAVTVTNSSGAVVATGTISGSQLCFTLPPDTYTITAVWNEAQTITKTVNLTPGTSTTNVGFTFLDLVTVKVFGCNGPITGALVQCGEVEATTNGGGIAYLNFSDAVPPPYEVLPGSPIPSPPVTVTIPSGPTQTHGALEVTGVLIPCLYVFTFIYQFCITVTGCNGNLSGATVSVSGGGDSFIGETNTSGQICWIPTIDWTGKSITVVVSKAYYKTKTMTELAFGCGFGVGLAPLDCYMCCGTCPDPVPSVIVITDINGPHLAPGAVVPAFDGQPPTCQWGVCYRAPLPADLQWNGTTVAIYYGFTLSGAGSMELSTSWVARNLAPSYFIDSSFGCGVFGGPGDATAPDYPDGVNIFWGPSCTVPINLSGTLPPTAQFTTDPVAGPVSISDGCKTSLGGVARVFARGSSPDPAAAGSSGYVANLSIDTEAVVLQLLAYVEGTSTSLAVISATGGPGDWYNVQLSCEGTAIAVQVQRQSDGQYIQTTGLWGATQTNCLTVTSSSVSGNGYMGIGLTSSESAILESDSFSIPPGAFPGAITENWDEVIAPALPSTTGFVYSGSLVTNGSPTIPAISTPNVIEAPAGATGYVAYGIVDTNAGNVMVSAWFAAAVSSYYYGGGGSGLPSTISVTFDGSAIWGSYAGQTLALNFDAPLGDYPSACLATGTDGGHCDPSGATEGLITVSLTLVQGCTGGTGGLVNATVQWTGGTAGAGCADGGCEYYGTATRSGVPMGGTAQTLDFTLMTFGSGGTGSFSPATIPRSLGFTTPGDTTWTCPPGVTSVQVECWGGGGSSASTCSAGAGGGAYARGNAVPVTPGTAYAIHVGSGGSGAGTGGQAGDGSYFGSVGTVFAEPGQGATTDIGAAGGSASLSVGDVVYSGGNGGNPTPELKTYGGGGGGNAGPTGPGGNGGDGTDSAGGEGGSAGTSGGNGEFGTGQNGFVPGGGGGGGGLGTTGASSGGNGKVLLTWSVGEPAAINLEVPCA